MKTKTLLLSAVAGALGLASASAQVYSVNAVGYVNLTLEPGWNMINNPLDAGSEELNDILPTLPDGSLIVFFRGGAFSDSAEYFEGVGWFADTLPTWPAGEGAFVNVPSQTTVTFVGEVRQGSLSTSLPAGFSIRGSQVPQEGTLDELGLPGEDSDTVVTWDSAAQAYAASAEYFSGVGWFSDPAITVGVGEAFFVNSSSAKSWDRNFSVNN